MEKEIENNKLWGLYPSFLVPEQIDKLDEIDIWKKIDTIGGTLFWINHDAGKPWAQTLSANELNEIQYALEYLVYFTRKYGVEFSKEPSVKEHIERSNSYVSWFSFWKNHFESISSEMYNTFVEDKFSGKDISKYMPKETWKEHYNKSKVKKLTSSI